MVFSIRFQHDDRDRQEPGSGRQVRFAAHPQDRMQAPAFSLFVVWSPLKSPLTSLEERLAGGSARRERVSGPQAHKVLTHSTNHLIDLPTSMKTSLQTV